MSLSRRDGHLLLDGVDLVDVAGRFGTPLYVYGADAIRGAARELVAALPDDVELLYSVKANPSLAVARVLAREGLGAEIASAGELALAAAAGFDPARTRFAGPGKSDAELAAALDAGLAAVHVESPGELERLASLAADRGRVQPVALRLNLDLPVAAGARIVTAGGAQKFGTDVAAAGALLDALAAHPSLALDGFHVFAGSQVPDHRDLLALVDASLEAIGALCADRELTPAHVDLGGGLGVSQSADQPAFDVAAFGAGLAARLDAARRRPCFAATRFLLEPGRFLVSAAGVYLTRVLDTKRSGDRPVAIVDGGIHQALLPITSNGYRVVRADAETEPSAEEVLLGGPLCTSVDQWFSGAPLPDAAPGDLLALLNAGAYGLSASLTLFLSHGAPAEVLLDDGAAHLVRRRTTPADLLRDQSLPDHLR